jgi:hypothetical protein
VLGAREARPGLRKGGPTQQVRGVAVSLPAPTRLQVDLPAHTQTHTQRHTDTSKVFLHSTTRLAIEHEREAKRKKKKEANGTLHPTQHTAAGPDTAEEVDQGHSDSFSQQPAVDEGDTEL